MFNLNVARRDALPLHIPAQKTFNNKLWVGRVGIMIFLSSSTNPNKTTYLVQLPASSSTSATRYSTVAARKTAASTLT